MNELAERPKIPRQQTNRFTNLTREVENSLLAEAVGIYLLSFVHCNLSWFQNLLSVRVQRAFSAVARRISGRNVSLVIVQGERKPGRSTTYIHVNIQGERRKNSRKLD